MQDLSQLLFPLAIGLVLYFFMIRPQQRKAAETKRFRESLVRGARVVTIGGLHGQIVEITDQTVLLETERGVRLRFDRTAVAREAGSGSSTGVTAATSAAS